MTTIINMTKYRLHIWIQGHLYIMPLVALVLYDGFCFSIKPARLVTCVVMLCFGLFFAMVWMGYMIADREDPVEEQLLYLRMVRKSSYYLGKSVFLLTAQLIFSALAMAVPVLLRGNLFAEPVTAGDLVQCFLLVSGSAGAGIALGSLLPPEVMRDRRLSLLLTVFMAVLSVLGSVLKEYAVAAWFIWLLPPVSAIGKVYGNSNILLPEKTIALWGTLVLYTVVYLAVGNIISHRLVRTRSGCHPEE